MIKQYANHTNKWLLFSISGSDACTFDHSIMVEPNYRSFDYIKEIEKSILDEI